MTKQELEQLEVRTREAYRRYWNTGVVASGCILAAGISTLVSDTAACFFAGAASVSFVSLLREAFGILTFIERSRRFK